MWARVIEFNLGCWLALSPFIFRHSANEAVLWWNDLACAFVVAALALISYSHRFRYAHLALGLVGIWLIGFGYFMSSHPVPAALQNDVMVGWLLLMFAIIPNQSSHPPDEWNNSARCLSINNYIFGKASSRTDEHQQDNH